MGLGKLLFSFSEFQTTESTGLKKHKHDFSTASEAEPSFLERQEKNPFLFNLLRLVCFVGIIASILAGGIFLFVLERNPILGYGFAVLALLWAPILYRRFRGGHKVVITQDFQVFVDSKYIRDNSVVMSEGEDLNEVDVNNKDVLLKAMCRIVIFAIFSTILFLVLS